MHSNDNYYKYNHFSGNVLSSSGAIYLAESIKNLGNLTKLILYLR